MFSIAQPCPVAMKQVMKFPTMQSEEEATNLISYQTIIQSHMYVMTITPPDTSYVIAVSRQYNHDLHTKYLVAHKHAGW